MDIIYHSPEVKVVDGGGGGGRGGHTRRRIGLSNVVNHSDFTEK